MSKTKFFVTRKRRNELISQIMPLLNEARELQKFRMKKSGYKLQAMGVKKDEKGNVILSNRDYFVTIRQIAAVPHVKNLITILRTSKTEEKCDENLALYIAKYSDPDKIDAASE